MQDPNCVFCKIAAGDIPANKIWEDDSHIAFLNLHPNTEGFTVLIPKFHYTSYFAELPPSVLSDLMIAAQKVAKLLDLSFEDVGRTGLMFEGWGVNHIHAKLSPMHGTIGDEWIKRSLPYDAYYKEYPGYISSHDAAQATSEQLELTQHKITDHN